MSDEKKLVVKMEAYGTVRNPDGTEKEIILRAERPLTEDEVKDYGDHAFDCSG
jgi:hypothetical protein